MSNYSLSEGTLKVIMKGGDVTDPIMQVLGCKPIASGSLDKERYRILLSDGVNVISFAMITTQIKDKLSTGELTPNTIIKIKRYITSVINNAGKGNKRVLVILDMEVLVSGEKTVKIGQPEQLPDDYLESEAKMSNGTSSTVTSYNGSTSTNTTVATKPMLHNNSDSMLLQDQLIHPISSLSPYQNKWVIKARVTNKTAIRKWSNSRGEGQLFSLDLLDESGEIRVTAFRELVDKFYELFQTDHVYYISKCQIKVANKQFSTLKNDYEMTFTNDSIVQECFDAGTSIPQTQYDFVGIDKIAHIEVETLIDVIGVCKTTSELQVFQSKTGKELTKREITVVDQSNSGVALTLWGSSAENFDGSTRPIIVIKGAKVGEFGGGKTVSALLSSIMKINPDIPEAHRLRGWFDNGGMEENVTNISARSGSTGMQTTWMCLKDSQDMSMHKNADKGEYFQTKATILLIRSENAVYKACPADGCNKKIVDLQNGMYRCEKCNREYPNFKYRLLAFINIGDWSGNAFITTFASEGERILGMTSQAIGEAIENNPEAMAEIADQAHFKQFLFKCRVRTENYNDETRLRTVAVQVDDINYKEYHNHLISRIQELQQELNQA